MKLLLLFTTNTSLKDWYERGIYSREIQLYKKISQKGIEIKFLTYGDKSELEFAGQLSPIKIIPCKKYINSKIRIIELFKRLILPIRLKRILRDVDIIKTNQIIGGFIGCIAKLFFGKRLIVRAGYERFYNFMVKTKRRGILNYIKYLYHYILIYLNEFILYKLADHIILTTLEDISFITKMFKLRKKERNNKIHHIYNFIDTELFKPAGNQKEDKSVFYIGRIVHDKNLHNLINAFRGLKDFKLYFIGNGELKNKLKKRSEKLEVNLTFLGTIPNNKLPKVINQYQIFILPSYFEGNPKVLLESMSCGITCIGSNIKGINNIITHGKNGYLCNFDFKSIRDAIISVYKNEILRESISVNARKFVMENCDLNLVADKEFEIYKQISELRIN